MAYVLPWIERADRDFFAARHLAENMRPIPTEIVCFHCQQAVEKYLKAFIVYNDREPPKIHDLTELLKQCCEFNSDISAFSQKCKFLMPFAVRNRYPGGADPEENDMKIAFTYTADIIEFVKTKIAYLKSGIESVNEIEKKK